LAPNCLLMRRESAVHLLVNVCNIEQSSPRDSGIIPEAMKRPLSPKKVVAVRCPTCGAKPGERCELMTGQPRTNPHRDRRAIAKD